MAKAEATVDELVGMIERGDHRLKSVAIRRSSPRAGLRPVVLLKTITQHRGLL